MNASVNTLRVEAYRRFSWIVAIAVMLLGGLVLLGWTTGITTLKAVLPGAKAMNPVSAITLVLTGLALHLSRVAGGGPNQRRWGRILALVTVTVGVLRLGDCLTVWSIDLDRDAFTGGIEVARMAPNTALAFIFSGLALLLMSEGRETGSCPAQWMALPPLGIAILALLGYFYHAASFYAVASFEPMSFPSAVSFCLLSLGILALHPERGLMALFVSDSIGGVMARRLLPASLLVLSLAGWLRLQGEHRGLYDLEYGLSLFTATNVFMIAALILWVGRQMARIDDARLAASDELRKARDEMERRVGERTRDLTQVVDELRQGVTILAASARDIMAVTSGMATGSDDITSALAATASTVEEMRQMAHVTSDHAGQVAESSRRAAGMSACGKMATEGTIEGMHRIVGEMTAIDGCMSRLREQARTIGQIITAVDDLAAQSNLLAVNAAIEAAKAGEQGKGFGVVAREVKHLAQQSKQATQQVRAVLGEIQKAARAAMAATEHGRVVVEEGGSQSVRAGESIEALASILAEAVRASEQIAASLRQQRAGADHVAEAMAKMHEVSVGYANGTARLKSAAHNLDDLGQRLKTIADGRSA
jgi:methyl-accepting chemotaxis protein